MKAINYTNYGGPEVLQLGEIEKPAPGEGQILVRVQAASVNALDWRRFTMPQLMARAMDGWSKTPPNTAIGADIAGTVEAVGGGVSRFKPGDAVFGICRGGFAEYALAAQDNLVMKPGSVSFEAAAAVPIAALTALQSLNKAGVKSGQAVLVVGASGGVGTFAVQIAKAFGAEVTATCSTRNLEMVRSIGADEVLDYTKEDFTQSGKTYDVVLVANGNHTVGDFQRALKPGGACVVAGGMMPQFFQVMLLGGFASGGGKKVGFMGVATPNAADLETLRGLLEAGKINPVIDRRYPLGEVAQAIRYMLDEHARGKVVISVGQESSRL